jgi:hemolysin D
MCGSRRSTLITLVCIAGEDDLDAPIANGDIGFVEPGQSAVVKVEAFPFTRYGTIEGHVAKVSRDAVDERDATNLSDAANAAKPQSGGSAQPLKTQNLVFPATIALTRRTIDVDSKQVGLTPGMAVTVEIKTGQRRAIDYVLSPLREVATRAGRER